VASRRPADATLAKWRVMLDLVCTGGGGGRCLCVLFLLLFRADVSVWGGMDAAAFVEAGLFDRGYIKVQRLKQHAAKSIVGSLSLRVFNSATGEHPAMRNKRLARAFFFVCFF
jgi:hypothetical protein